MGSTFANISVSALFIKARSLLCQGQKKRVSSSSRYCWLSHRRTEPRAFVAFYNQMSFRDVFIEIFLSEFPQLLFSFFLLFKKDLSGTCRIPDTARHRNFYSLELKAGVPLPFHLSSISLRTVMQVGRLRWLRGYEAAKFSRRLCPLLGLCPQESYLTALYTTCVFDSFCKL